MLKASDKEIELHNLILAGDDLALTRLYDLYGEAIFNYLKGKFSKAGRTDDLLLREAVNEAFFGYSKNPRTFNPQKLPLLKFLEMAAKRDLMNILEKNKDYIDGKINLPEDVELQEKYWNSISEGESDPETAIIDKQVTQSANKILAQHFDNDTDIELAKLIIVKTRETEKFAAILGITSFPVTEQKKEVKRHKDRIKQVLKRNKVEETIKKLML